MFLLPSIAVGFIVALALGGRPRRVLELRLRFAWAAPLALAAQVVAFSQLVDLPVAAAAGIHLASYGLLVLFAVANWRTRSLLPVILGMLLNGLAIGVNGGVMPLSEGAAAAAGIDVGGRANVSTDAVHLRFLGDVFALPPSFPFANAFSIGDILIGIGMVAFIAAVSLPRSENLISASRLLAPLQLPNFRLVASGRLVSQIGDWMTLTAIVGWMFEQTHSTYGVISVLLVRMVPPILGGGLAAMLVDRLPKRPLLILVELGRGLFIATAFLAVAAGQPVAMLAALFGSGLLAALSAAAVPALVPRLVTDDRYEAANAGLGIADNAAAAIGALGGGLVLTMLGVESALIIDLSTFVLAAILFAGLRLQPGAAEQAARAVSRFYGLRYMLSRRRLVVLVLSFGTATLATGLVNATLPRFLELNTGLGAGAYGYAFAAIMAGLAAGQLGVGVLRLGSGASRWIACGLLLMAGLLAVLAFENHAATILLVLAAIGIVDGTTDIVFETVIQREAEPHVLGSIFGFAGAFIRTTMILSVALAPIANRFLNVTQVLLVAAVFLTAAAAVALLNLYHASPSELEASQTVMTVATTEEHAGASLRRLGNDLSLIVWGDFIPTADAAAAKLAANGIAVEILDLSDHSNGWDKNAVLQTVTKTSKVLIFGNGGLDTELAAVIVEDAFEHLDAPVRRIAAADADELASRLRELASY